MKLKTALLIALFTISCAVDPLVGKWKASRELIKGEWRAIPTNVLLEVSDDDKFIITTSDGWKRTGSYTTDNGSKPHRFTASDETGRKIRGIYKVEGDRFTVRAGEDLPDSELPTDFNPNEAEDIFLVEFERKRE
jgi:uncharacterized protein (TIGR03067 family)